MWINTGRDALDPKRVAVEDLSTEQVYDHLNHFRAAFHQRHGRPIRESDSKDLPEQILALFDQVGRRLNADERAKASARLEEQRVAEKEAAAAAEAKRLAARAARDEEWRAFEAQKEELWKSAVGEAKDQRVEVAQAVGLSSERSLSGAASFEKQERPSASSQPTTREEFVQQALDLNGLRFVPDAAEEPHEAAEWASKGGAEADETARREAWEARAAGST